MDEPGIEPGRAADKAALPPGSPRGWDRSRTVFPGLAKLGEDRPPPSLKHICPKDDTDVSPGLGSKNRKTRQVARTSDGGHLAGLLVAYWVASC